MPGIPAAHSPLACSMAVAGKYGDQMDLLVSIMVSLSPQHSIILPAKDHMGLLSVILTFLSMGLCTSSSLCPNTPRPDLTWMIQCPSLERLSLTAQSEVAAPPSHPSAVILCIALLILLGVVLLHSVDCILHDSRTPLVHHCPSST